MKDRLTEYVQSTLAQISNSIEYNKQDSRYAKAVNIFKLYIENPNEGNREKLNEYAEELTKTTTNGIKSELADLVYTYDPKLYGKLVETKTLIAEIIQHPDIAKQIMKYFGFGDLEKARLVSKNWEKTASALIDRGMQNKRKLLVELAKDPKNEKDFNKEILLAVNVKYLPLLWENDENSDFNKLLTNAIMKLLINDPSNIKHVLAYSQLPDAILMKDKAIISHHSWLELNAANLMKSNLSRVDFNGAILEDADMRGANMSHANLNDTFICNGNLTDANLSHANLLDTILWGANLSGANLTGANLSGASLAGNTMEPLKKGDLPTIYPPATLENANLTNANLSNTKISYEQLNSTSSIWNCQTSEQTFSQFSKSDMINLKIRMVHEFQKLIDGAPLNKIIDLLNEVINNKTNPLKYNWEKKIYDETDAYKKLLLMGMEKIMEVLKTLKSLDNTQKSQLIHLDSIIHPNTIIHHNTMFKSPLKVQLEKMAITPPELPLRRNKTP